MITHEKPKTFYPYFERKGPKQEVTHYCPGCGHGNVHKMIAELLAELDIQDRTIFLSPVGCSVFGYYYFDTGNFQCAHGRAPAVGTGVKRVLEDSIVISYQGDGDLAGIGTTEIIHSANRGENMTVIFVNNAIYGMTGGQMAPTTLVGQRTLTTPDGRDLFADGAPIGMAEIMDAIKTPVFIERTSLATPAGIRKTRKAIKKGLENQMQKKGFSFIEILSPCPINWKMDPIAAREWITNTMEHVFPAKNFRDNQEAAAAHGNHPWLDDAQVLKLFQGDKELPHVKEHPLKQDHLVKIAGFGGQGVLSAGILLANCAISEGLNASWLPSYGPEMRGGTANASVILSSKEIGSPLVDDPTVLLAMNRPSLLGFVDRVHPGGLVILNSSVIQDQIQRSDLRILAAPATDIAKEEGVLAAANMILLTLYILDTGVIDIETLKKIVPLSLKRQNLLDANMRLIQRAQEYYQTHYGSR